MSSKQVDVSVCILTYYHEKYITQALESVLMQKTKYSYEIVVADDNSKDGTMDILKDYQLRYPDTIHIINNEKNVGIPRNIFNARCNCHGKYIIGLSGDDYWISERKIEIQCDFLENNPDYFLVGCSVEARYDNDTIPFKVYPPRKDAGKEFTITDYENGKTLSLHGFMMRNVFRNEDDRKYFAVAQQISSTVDDSVDTVLFLKYGKIFVLEDVLNVYRVNRTKTGNHNYNSKYSRLEQFRNIIDLFNSMYGFFGEEISFKKKYTKAYANAILGALSTRSFNGYREVYLTIPDEYRKPWYSGVMINAFPIIIREIVKKIVGS